MSWLKSGKYLGKAHTTSYNSRKKEGQSTMHKLEVAGLQPSANVVPLKSGKVTA